MLPPGEKGLEVRMEYDARDAHDGARRPKDWTFRSPTAAGDMFTGGALHLSFDADCRFREGGIALQDLRRAAAARMTRPELGYRRGGDGRLVPLAAQLGGGAGLRACFTILEDGKPVARGAEP